MGEPTEGHIVRLRITLLTAAVLALMLGPTNPVLAGNPCGMPDRWPTEPSTAATTEIHLEACAFTPTVAHVDPGASVAFHNLNPGMAHTITGVGASVLGWKEWTGETRTWTAPDEAGVYPFACALHPGMVGAIVVGDVEPAATGDDLPVAAASTEANGAAGGRTRLLVTAGAAALLAAALLWARRARSR